MAHRLASSIALALLVGSALPAGAAEPEAKSLAAQVDSAMKRGFVWMGTASDGPPTQPYVSPSQTYMEWPVPKPVDGLVTVWTIAVPPGETPVEGHVGYLVLQPRTFDCRKQLYRLEDGVALDAGDEVVGQPEGGDWQAVVPASMSSRNWKLACGLTEPYGDTLTGLAGVRFNAADTPFY